MRTALAALFGLVVAIAPAAAQDDQEAAQFARIQTSMGDIDVALEREAAPVTTENFLEYATSGYYDRLIFHRVIPDTLIQGGGFSAQFYERATRDPIVNEASNGLRNERGTIAMARYSDPDSATSQFFVNLRDNPDLDRTGDTYDMDAGYTVFGHVVAGMAVADAIGAVETGPGPAGTGLDAEVPVEPVLILRIDPIAEDEVGATQDSAEREDG
ncbi:peptidylprolyl isomerase [Parvularcula oceani]|uniref:peptidylprolyl isomerase n=1 Tax=Parvularcula oceani TaxID=1247963 RepID=UPI0009DF2318|nr:peptidylprolyl isomerase [Parvularcula oceani]